jgi:hypothetical protein
MDHAFKNSLIFALTAVNLLLLWLLWDILTI